MSKEQSKSNRIHSEELRLKKIYRGMPKDKLKLVAGLISRAAFLRIELEDLELDLLENGWTEPFQQSRGMEPYDRARPQGQTYQTSLKNFRDTIKQLDAMLQQTAAASSTAADDGFADFVNGRDDP